jgi:hypothetical protein
LRESQDFKVPQLRNIYQKMNFTNGAGAVSVGGFGLTHEGTDPTLQFFLSRPVFVNILGNTKTKNDLAAFVLSFDTGIAPAVGYSRTLTSANVATSSVTNDWLLLENQASVRNIDLIVKGTIDGQRHGLLYQTNTGTYRVDTTTLAALTHAQLYAKILAGDKLTIMGVPLGAGLRMGIDRDGDGILDGDAPPPRLQIALAGGKTIINWPFSAAGFGLETANTISSTIWSKALDPWEIVANQNFITNSPSVGARFFRLHSP